MAKNWTVIRTDRVSTPTKAERTAKAKIAKTVINKIVTKDFEGLKKEGDETHATNIAAENALLANKDKIQSEALKNKIVAIEKKRAAAAEKKRKGKPQSTKED